MHWPTGVRSISTVPVLLNLFLDELSSRVFILPFGMFFPKDPPEKKLKGSCE